MSGESGTADACSGWNNESCTGTPYCPPRCPRFFDRDGTPIVIRPLGDGTEDARADLAQLVSMYEAMGASTRVSGLPPTTRDGIESWLAEVAERGWNLLALAGGECVGHVGVAPADDGAVDVVVFVAEEYRSRGIGTELVKQLVAYAADRDYDEVWLSVERGNDGARSIYESLAFEVSERHLSTVEMRLTLDEPLADEVRRPPAER